MTACHPSFVIYYKSIWVAGDLNHIFMSRHLGHSFPNLISTLNATSSARHGNKNI